MGYIPIPAPLETEVFLGSLSLSLIPLIIPDSLLLSITAVDSWPDEDRGPSINYVGTEGQGVGSTNT